MRLFSGKRQFTRPHQNGALRRTIGKTTGFDNKFFHYFLKIFQFIMQVVYMQSLATFKKCHFAGGNSLFSAVKSSCRRQFSKAVGKVARASRRRVHRASRPVRLQRPGGGTPPKPAGEDARATLCRWPGNSQNTVGIPSTRNFKCWLRPWAAANWRSQRGGSSMSSKESRKVP
jgi:hypothetical protein